jgi:hypothetical protein
MKTHKELDHFNPKDVVRIYSLDGKLKYNRIYFMDANSLDIQFLYRKSCIEVVEQFKRRKITKEYLLECKLTNFPMKCYTETTETKIISCFINDKFVQISYVDGGRVVIVNITDKNYESGLYLDPPTHELIDVVPYWEQQKTRSNKIKVKIYSHALDRPTTEEFLAEYIRSQNCILEVLDVDHDKYLWEFNNKEWLYIYKKDVEYIVNDEKPRPENIWLVKSINAITVVDLTKNDCYNNELPYLRSYYPNCQYRKLTDGGWAT